MPDKNQAESLSAARTDHAKTALQRLIVQLAYDLYGLADDDIRIIEEATP